MRWWIWDDDDDDCICLSNRFVLIRLISLCSALLFRSSRRMKRIEWGRIRKGNRSDHSLTPPSTDRKTHTHTDTHSATPAEQRGPIHPSVSAAHAAGRASAVVRRPAGQPSSLSSASSSGCCRRDCHPSSITAFSPAHATPTIANRRTTNHAHAHMENERSHRTHTTTNTVNTAAAATTAAPTVIRSPRLALIRAASERQHQRSVDVGEISRSRSRSRSDGMVVTGRMRRRASQSAGQHDACGLASSLAHKMAVDSFCHQLSLCGPYVCLSVCVLVYRCPGIVCDVVVQTD